MALRILGVGSPILDLLARVDDDFLKKYVPGEKGGMQMVEPEFFERVLPALPLPPDSSPGGSTGNTIFALAKMGVPAAMLGKVGNDTGGAFYSRKLRELGGSEEAFVRAEGVPTGVCLSLITPDAERTMRTCLGAAGLLTPEEAAGVHYAHYDLVHIEGYMLFSPVLPVVLERARAAGCRISFDCASFEVVRAFCKELPEMLKQYVDIIIANEDEADELLPGLSHEEQLEELSRWGEIAVIKLGRQGAIAARGKERVRVPACLVEHPADTTAAGDLWAAGFFYGLSRAGTLEQCAQCGSLFAGEVVQVIGSAMPESSWAHIRSRLPFPSLAE